MPVKNNPVMQPHPARWVLVLLGAVAQYMGTKLLFDSGPVDPNQIHDPRILGALALNVCGLITVIVGLGLVAKAKGRSPWWGALGLLSAYSWIGLLLAVAVFTRLSDQSGATESAPAKAPPRPEQGRIRDAGPDDLAAIVALNDAEVELTSPLDQERLTQLDSMAAYHRVLEDDNRVGAFLLAFREGAGYESPNYQWFKERLDRFVYIDRIVVEPSRRGTGAARRLYEDLKEFAREAGVHSIVCEYLSEPPNVASAGFHAAMGFTEMGRQRLGESGKCVSYQILEL